MIEIRNINITAEILKAVAELDEFKGRWQAFENIIPERLVMLNRKCSQRS